MKKINLYGCRLTIYCAEELLNAGAMIDSRYKDIGDDLYLFGLETKKDYMVASGKDAAYEWDSLPQTYLDSVTDNRREEVRGYFVWLYDSNIFGRPLDIRTLLPGIFQAALREWKRG